MSDLSTALLDYALRYYENQFSVIPLATKDKKPIFNWKTYQNKRPDKEQIRKWFSNNEYNIAISTGKVSSIIAFDIDGDNAKDYFEDRVEKLDDEGIRSTVKNTMCIKTGSGNSNIVIGIDPSEFLDGQEVKNTVLWRGKDAHNEIRLKAEGGYIVAPPSIHPNGNRYELLNEVLTPIYLSKAQIFKLIDVLKRRVKYEETAHDGQTNSNENSIDTSYPDQLKNEDIFDIIAFLNTHYRQGEKKRFCAVSSRLA